MRTARACATLDAVSESTQLIVELDAESDPVQGRIGRRDEGGTPFSGYVQLIAALEGYRKNGGYGPDAAAATSGYRGERGPAAP
jgi:hypothetical protein